MPRRASIPKAKSAQAADSAKRATRTGVQGGISTTLLIQGWNLFSGHPLSFEQTAWVTALGAAMPALVSYLMNMVEDATGHALLKGESDVEPVTTLTPEQMLATAEYLTHRARHNQAEPRVFTEQETSPPRAGTAPPMPHVDIPPGGGRG